MRPGYRPSRSLLRLRPGLIWMTAAASAAVLLANGCSDSTSPESSCNDPGVVCTWAGTGQAGFNGDGLTPLQSSFYWPVDLSFTSTGEIYILDWNNHRVRHVTPDGKLETVVGNSSLGDGPCGGFLDGCEYSDVTAPGAPGTEISLNHPTEMLELPDGKMLLACWHNHKLRTYDPTTGLVLVACGSAAGFAGDGGDAHEARINQPNQIAISPAGEIYILDQRNQRIRKIGVDGIITTVAGTGVAGFSGDGGDPLAAQVRFPAGSNPPPAGGIVLDSAGNIYFSDILNHRIRKVDFGANRIETVAGNGVAGFGGDGGPATQASLNNPRDLEFGPDGRLYIADEKNHRIRALDPTTGIITTVAGRGVAGFTGDGGMAVDASFHGPTGIAFDGQGRLYIADTENHRIRRVTL